MNKPIYFTPAPDRNIDSQARTPVGKRCIVRGIDAVSGKVIVELTSTGAKELWPEPELNNV